MWADQYVGLPFRDGGREKPYLDCWGLVRVVYLDRLGIELPDFPGLDHAGSSTILQCVDKSINGGPWFKVDRAGPFDVALMLGHYTVDGITRAAPIHVGVCIDHKWLLHTEKSSNAVCVAMDSFTISRRILGYYRHAACTCQTESAIAGTQTD